MEIKQTFTIDCNTWRCGDKQVNVKTDPVDINSNTSLGMGNTSLLNEQGFMCCLGQIAKQLDVYQGSLLSIGEPSEMPVADAVEPLMVRIIEKDEFGNTETDYFANTELSTEAMTINDHLTITIADKMADLKDLFKSEGYRLEFINVP